MVHIAVVDGDGAADLGGFDAAEDGPHGGQSLLAGDLRLPVMLQGVHKLVDDAGIGLRRDVVGGTGAVQVPDLDGGCLLYTSDAADE